MLRFAYRISSAWLPCLQSTTGFPNNAGLAALPSAIIWATLGLHKRTSGNSKLSGEKGLDRPRMTDCACFKSQSAAVPADVD